MIKSSRIHWALAIVAAIIFLLTHVSPVSYTTSDPAYTLLTSQALVEHATIKLDGYGAAIASPLGDDARLQTVNGHTYYYFPIGTSLFAVPFVWVANWLGLDMRNVEHDALLQNLLSAIISVALFFITYRICLYYLKQEEALLLAAIFTLGSTFVSTIGTALWNLGMETLFILLCLWLMIRRENQDDKRSDPYLFGIFMFAAFLSRPTAMVFIVLSLIFTGIRHTSYYARAIAAAVVLLGLFFVFSRMEYGSWLPAYYLPARLGSGDTPFHMAVYGLLFSPSRGIFTYSPMFLLASVLSLYLLLKMRLRSPLLIWFAVIWFCLSVFSVSSFGHWWGGHSYGPRLLTDAVPALILSALVSWQVLRTILSTRALRWVLALFLVLSTVSIVNNSIIGLFNVQTIRWNGDMLSPSIDLAPQYLFSWRYPQFAASKALICHRNEEYFETSLETERITLAPYRLGQAILAQEAQQTMRLRPAPDWFILSGRRSGIRFAAEEKRFPYQSYLPLVVRRWPVSSVFVGWTYHPVDTVDAVCNVASIVLGPAGFAEEDEDYLLKLDIDVGDLQNVQVGVNGVPTKQLVRKVSQSEELTIEAETLFIDEPNWITFYFTDQEVARQLEDRSSFLSVKALIIDRLD